jgi:hypothetical protein
MGLEEEAGASVTTGQEEDASEVNGSDLICVLCMVDGPAVFPWDPSLISFGRFMGF